MIGRARDCGVGALVLTVDVPIHPKRERNWRNGFASVRNGGVMEALKLKPSILLEAMTHPAWVIDYVRHGGAPTLGNWAPHAGNGASKADAIRLGRSQTPAAAQTWRDLERYRRLFPRPLVVKGILSPADAVRAAEIGVDGIIVSNHGGRQLDQAPASLDALPAIKAAVGDKVTVMLDSGVRRGADILIARASAPSSSFSAGRHSMARSPAAAPGSRRRSTSSAPRSIWSWPRSAARASTELGPDFLWRDDWTQNR